VGQFTRYNPRSFQSKPLLNDNLYRGGSRNFEKEEPKIARKFSYIGSLILRVTKISLQSSGGKGGGVHGLPSKLREGESFKVRQFEYDIIIITTLYSSGYLNLEINVFNLSDPKFVECSKI
jgi:hypothetical protein